MSFLDRILKKKEPKPTGTVDTLGVTAISAGGIYKAYIPNFLYKPNFGYPRTDLDLFTIQDLSKTPYVWGVKKAIKDRISATDWNIVPKDGEENTDELKAKAMEIEEKLRNPNANQESFNDVQRAVMEDILNYDSGVIVKVFNKKQDMVEFYARAGYSFLINPDIHGSLRGRDDIVEFMFQQGNDDSIMRQSFSAQYKNTAAFFQYGWTPGSLPVPFGKREIIYFKANPRTESVYGYSPVQVLKETILTLLYGGRSALDSYINNNIPPGILGVSGASQKEIDNIRSRMDERMNEYDEFSNWRKKPYIMPMIGTREKGGLDFMQFSFNSKDMEVLEKQKWYQKLVWSVFGVNSNEMGECYSEDTRVLTEDGFKYYFELNLTDKIATVNESNHFIEYINPTEIRTFDVIDKDFHHYKSSRVDILVSTNHRMYYRTMKDPQFKMSFSNEIPVNTVKLLQGGLHWKGDDLKEYNIDLVNYNNNKDINRKQQTTFDINDFCEFMGYYLSEGSVLKGMNIKKTYTIKISQTDKDNILIMKPLLERLGFKREDTCWSLSNKSLAIYLSKFGCSTEKYIPKELKNLPVDKLKILFDALVLGDGCRSKQGSSISYTTSSKKLAADVLEIMLKIGYKASMNFREFKNKKWNTSYIVNANLNQIEPRLIISKQRINEKYTGVMWCPHVYNKPFITERNGKISINYNTESSNKATDIGQSRIIKRRAIKPYLIMLEYAYNTQLITELDDTGKLRFQFDDYDIEEDFRLNELYEKKMQYMSVNEIRDLEGLEEVEDGDKIQGTQDPFNSQFGGDQDQEPNNNQENQQEKDESKKDEKEEKLKSNKEDKPKPALPQTERTDLEKEMIDHYKGVEKRIIELVKGD